MASQMISLEVGDELLRLIEQRAKQEGINRSEYVREAIILEMLFPVISPRCST